MTKDVFNYVFEFARNYPWIDADGLFALLFDECRDDIDRSLIKTLIKRFLYIDTVSYYTHIEEIVQQITSNFNENDTLITATAMDFGSDSSEEIIYYIKTLMPKFSWHTANIRSNMRKSLYENRVKNIIVIDEFNGSGQTALNRYNKIVRDFNEKGVHDINIYFYYIVSTEFAHNHVLSQDIYIESLNLLKQGISDYDTKEENTTLMRDLEKSVLAEKVIRRDIKFEMPSFGYNASEALYIRERGNTPNNVFPIFWWPENIDNLQRKTLLQRAM